MRRNIRQERLNQIQSDLDFLAEEFRRGDYARSPQTRGS